MTSHSFLHRLQLTAVLIVSAVVLGSCGAPEMVRSTYPSGKLMAEGQVLRRQQVGTWVYFFPSGVKQAAGDWSKDKQIGSWTWWYEDSAPQFQGSYVNGGLREGSWKAWHPDGKLASEGTYRFDRQDGPWRYWHPDGTPYAEGTFDLGVKHGWWVKRHSDGSPQECGLFIKGLKVGRWTSWVAGKPTVQDLGSPAGTTAQWVDDTWTMSGAINATLTVNAENIPLALLIQSDGRTVTSLPEDLAVFALKQPELTPPPSVPALTVPRELAAPQALTEVSSPVPASAPVLAANDAQIEVATAGLSPTPVIPTILAKGDMGRAGELIQQYSSGANPLKGNDIDSYYATTFDAKGGDPASRKMIGMHMPQERFLSSNGSVIDLKRFQRPVVVVVMRGFSGQVCIYCATQTAAIANNYKRFTEAGGDVVVIYPGPTESVPAFVQAVQTLRKDPPPMDIGLDVSLLLVRGLGIEENLAKPTSLVLDRDGNITYAYIGATMADRPSVDDLLQALRKAVK